MSDEEILITIVVLYVYLHQNYYKNVVFFFFNLNGKSFFKFFLLCQLERKYFLKIIYEIFSFVSL